MLKSGTAKESASTRPTKTSPTIKIYVLICSEATDTPQVISFAPVLEDGEAERHMTKGHVVFL